MSSTSTPTTSLRRRAERLHERIGARLEAITAAHGEGRREAWRTGVEGMMDLARTEADHEALAVLEASGEVARFRAALAPHVLGFVADAERRMRANLLALAPGPAKPTGELLAASRWGAYAGVARALASVDLAGCRSAVVVGCGPLPDSLVFLHEDTRIERLLGVDRDPRALAAARGVVDALGLERIELRLADAAELDYGDFELIRPSVFAGPRRAGIDRIAATAGKGALVFLSEPIGAAKLLFEPVVDSLPARFETYAEPVTPPGGLMLRRFLFRLGPG